MLGRSKRDGSGSFFGGTFPRSKIDVSGLCGGENGIAADGAVGKTVDYDEM